MPYKVNILADSVNITGERLTTWELTYPRMVHAELMTHRMFSRNAASSRAIPIAKMIEQVTTYPVMPVYWGKNQAGMQAAEALVGVPKDMAEYHWLRARDLAVSEAQCMVEWGVHKQIVNRLLEPWMWITVILSATTYGNWFNLRCHKDAQPEIKFVADWMAAVYEEKSPRFKRVGEWHLPLIDAEDDHELSTTEQIKVSVGRCARVSYLTHQGTRDVAADITLHDRLMESGHWSPFEHVAWAMADSSPSGNFTGWHQYRKQFETEHRSKWTWRDPALA